MAIFSLSGAEWEFFSQWFRSSKPPLLTKEIMQELKQALAKRGDDPAAGRDGHAVVVIACEHRSGRRIFKIKNSWGPSWARAGFFDVEEGALPLEQLLDVRDLLFCVANSRSRRR